MKKILFSALLFIATFANALNIGDTTPTFEIKDQFEKMHKISADAKTILVAESRGTSVIVREYLLSKDTKFLETNKAHYIADISGMPSLISKFIHYQKWKNTHFQFF